MPASLALRRINDVTVTPFSFPEDQTPVKGADLFRKLHKNIFLVGKKGKGKTTALFEILRRIINHKTFVMLAASTVFKDKLYGLIREWLEEGCYAFDACTTADQILDQVESMREEAEEKARGPPAPPPPDDGQPPAVDFGDLPSESEQEDEARGTKRHREPKPRAPTLVTVMDDMGEDMRKKPIPLYLKTQRHFDSSNICSSQDCKDLAPAQLEQMDYCLVWIGQNEDRLQHLHKWLSLSVPFVTFQEMYRMAAPKGEKGAFFYIATDPEEYRKNFDQVFYLKN